MGVLKDTKIFYQHSVQDSDFAGTQGEGVDEYIYRNKANDADITKTGIVEVLKDVIEHHTQGPNAKDSYPETILPLIVHANVDAAKAAIFHSDILAGYDTHCDNVSWALVDGDKGLKMTRDWKIEYNADADNHYKQFKDAMDSRFDSGTYLLNGAFITDSESHLF